MKNNNFSLRIGSLLKHNTFEDSIKQIKDAFGKIAIELNYPTFLKDENVNQIRDICSDNGITISAINPRFYEYKMFNNGSLSNEDNNKRELAVSIVKKCIDHAKKLNCNLVNIWLDADGYIYPFEKDYSRIWKNLAESLQEICDYDKTMKIALEYKYEHTPVKSIIRDAGRTLALIYEVNRDNIGANIDYNHCIMALENPAEVIDLFLSKNKLFNIHLNDSWFYDDDIMAGSVTPIFLIEVLYLLNIHNYQRYIFFDTKVKRGDFIKESKENIETIKHFNKIASEISLDKLKRLRKTNDPALIKEYLRKLIFK